MSWQVPILYHAGKRRPPYPFPFFDGHLQKDGPGYHHRCLRDERDNGPWQRRCTPSGMAVLWADYLDNNAGILIVPTAEVEDQDRIHHLIIMQDFEGFSELRSMLIPFSRDILTGGRPHVRLPGNRIAGMVHRLGGIIGPAHAFTPWTSLFSYYDQVEECYGRERVDFLELGLSADNSYGAAIPDLYKVLFITNSDAHSPDPAKCGREYTRLSLKRGTVEGVLSAVKSGHIEMNIGLFPEEGKYNRTACTRCYKHTPLYRPKDSGGGAR